MRIGIPAMLAVAAVLSATASAPPTAAATTHSATAGAPSAAGGITAASTERSRPSPAHQRWQVAAPLFFPVSGPAPIGHFPACTPGSLRTSARTRQTPNGIVGVVHLRHRKGHKCSLHVRRSPVGLLASNGGRLPIPSRGVVAVNKGASIRPDLDLHYGNAWWGFAWHGSWCGRRAAAVRMRLHSGRAVDVPLHGPAPACAGRSDSVVRRGLVGGRYQPLQTAPPAWSRLTAVLDLPARVDPQVLSGAALVVSNPTARPVVLRPCPYFAIGVGYHGRRGRAASYTEHSTSCRSRLVAPAAGSVRVPLHPTAYGSTSDRARRGSRVTVAVAVAGLGLLKASSHAR